MALSVKKIFILCLLMTLFFIIGYGQAQETSPAIETSGANEVSSPVMDMDEVIPLAAELSGRLADLKNKLKYDLDVSEIKKKFVSIELKLEQRVIQLQRLKKSKYYKYNKLVELRNSVHHENLLFKQISKPISLTIRQMEGWRKEWLAEKKNWEESRTFLVNEGGEGQLRSTFQTAAQTIETALTTIHLQLETMLKVQKKAGIVQTKISALNAELDSLIEKDRRNVLFKSSDSMFSSRYYSQFGDDLISEAKKNLEETPWPDDFFFARLGWLIFIQGVLIIIIITSVFRKRQFLKESESLIFLAERPFSAGLFLGTIMTFLFYKYAGVPSV